MAERGETQEFYLPPIDEPRAQESSSTNADSGKKLVLTVHVRGFLGRRAKHLHVLLVRGGECISVGFTDKHGSIVFRGLGPGGYVVLLHHRGDTGEKKVEVKEDTLCRISL